MWPYTKTLFALLVVALFLLPAGALAQNNTTSDSTDDTTTSETSDPSDTSACQEWQADADRMIQEFWDGEKSAWHAFIADMDQEARRFYESHPSREEADRWTQDWFARLHEHRGHAHDRAEAFHADMRAQADQYCGDASYYHAFHWDWPDPEHAQDASYHHEQADGGYETDGKYGDRPDHDAGYGYEQGYSEECRTWEDERRRAFDALHERFREEWNALEAEWRAFEAEQHSEEEWQAFERQMMDRERQLRNEEESAYRSLESDQPPEGCGYHTAGPGPATHGDDMGGRCDYGMLEEQMRQFEDRIRDRKEEFARLQDSKWARFDARMQEEIRDFESEEHSEAEQAEFEAFLEAEERRFHERMEQEERAFWDRADQERDEYRQRLEAECHGGAAYETGHDGRDGGPYGDDPMRRGPGGPHDRRGPGGPGGPSGGGGGGPEGFRGGPHFDEAYEAMEIARLECELSIKQETAAFMRKTDAAFQAAERSGDVSDSFYAEMDAERLAFEIDMRKKMLECQRSVQAQWQDKVGDHLDDASAFERMGSWTMEEDHDAGTAELRGTYMTITGDTMANVLTSVTVAGQVWLDGISTDSAFDPESFDMGDDGQASWLSAEGDGVQMRLHDNPSGLIRFRSDDGYSFFLQLPDYLDVKQTDAGWSLSDGDARALVRVAADSSAYDETRGVLTVWDKAEFLLPDHADNQVLKKVANKHRGEIMDAVEKHKVGAEITLAANNGDTEEETLVYEDVEVKVERPQAENQVAVTFSADHGEEGKTFVLNIEDQVVRVGGAIDVTYFDIDEATDAETEATIQKASSLSDILDATDDDSAEYWIVEDEDGVQVMVSVPNWSTHRVKVQGDEGGIFGAPAPGLGLLGLAALLGAVAVVTARRKDDEL